MKSSTIALALGLLLPFTSAASDPMATPGPELKARQATGALAPWITKNSDGSESTLTPVVTTDSAGKTTTINAQPTNVALTNVTAGLRTLKCDSTKYTQGGPFCEPSNGTVYFTGSSHLLTWDSSFWHEDEGKGTVTVFMYGVGEGDDGKDVYIDSWKDIDVVEGVLALEVKPEYMDKQINRTVRFDAHRVVPGSGATDNSGPMVILTTGAQPKQPHVRTPRSTIAIAVVLPLTVALVLLVIWAVFHFNRGERGFDRKGLRSKLGSKKFKKSGGGGYGERKSRAQRTGAGAAARAPLDDGEEDDWEMENMTGGRGGGAGGGGGEGAGADSTATGGFPNAPRERTKASPNNPFSDDYAR